MIGVRIWDLPTPVLWHIAQTTCRDVHVGIFSLLASHRELSSWVQDLVNKNRLKQAICWEQKFHSSGTWRREDLYVRVDVSEDFTAYIFRAIQNSGHPETNVCTQFQFIYNSSPKDELPISCEIWASTAVPVKPWIVQDDVWPKFVDRYRRFGAKYRIQLQGLNIPKTISILDRWAPPSNYQRTPRNASEEPGPELHTSFALPTQKMIVASRSVRVRFLSQSLQYPSDECVRGWANATGHWNAWVKTSWDCTCESPDPAHSHTVFDNAISTADCVALAAGCSLKNKVMCRH